MNKASRQPEAACAMIVVATTITGQGSHCSRSRSPTINSSSTNARARNAGLKTGTKISRIR